MNVDAWRVNFLYVDSVEAISRHCRILHAVRLNEDTMAEWLRRVIRNHLGLSRTGSSPVSVGSFFSLFRACAARGFTAIIHLG